MGNGKTLGAMNPRPSKSMNPRPSTTTNRPVGSQTTRPIANGPVRAMGNPSMEQMKPVKNVGVKVNIPEPKVIGQSSRPSGHVAQPAYTDSINNFVKIMREMVGGFAILSEDVIAQNLKLAGGVGMTADDRTISFECADYLMSNLSFILMGLVLDANFKQSFMESLMVEMQIDKQTPEVKAKTRESMKDKKEYKSNGSIVLGVTTFTPAVEKELMAKMQKGFDLLEPYADEFDAEVAKLQPNQKAEYGFIFSNFMYLIRAFTHNDMFMSYVITVIEKVKAITVNA